MAAARRRGAGWLWHLPLVAAVAFLRPASAAGLFFPDVDQLLLSVLGHRSVVTHSVLLPVLALGLAPAVLARLPTRRFGPDARAAAERSAAWFMGWFLLGLAIHLMADVVPLGCRGYALAKLPGIPLVARPSSLPCGASLLWYGANAMVALVLCEWLLRREGEAVTAARYLASGVVLAVYVLVSEGRPMLLPLLALAWAVAVLFARSVVRLAVLPPHSSGGQRRFLTSATTASGVMPKCSKSSSSGPEAPKPVMPTKPPSSPM